MENKIEIIRCDGLEIVYSLEAHQQEEHPDFQPFNILFYMEKGQLNFTIDQELYSIPRGKFGLMRKYTKVKYFKTWSKEEGFAKMYAFALHDDFIQSLLQDFNLPKLEIDQRFLELKSNKILKGLFESIVVYFADNQEVDKDLVKLKMKEALIGIFKTNPECISFFSEFSQPEQAELEIFMNHNFLLDVSLNELAKLSGRSLSTFNREFKRIFNESPHRWILKKRLNKAKEILLTSDQKPNQIYLDLGFKDLAHFSRTFKKQFGQTPTEVRKSIS